MLFFLGKTAFYLMINFFLKKVYLLI